MSFCLNIDKKIFYDNLRSKQIINTTIMKELIPGINEVIPCTFDELNIEGFDVIIDKFISEAPTVSNPELVHMLGIPAAGKSTFYQQNKEQFEGYVFIGFDFLMMAHPKYREDVEILGPVKAFEKWEIPARIAGYELLARSVKAKKNIFFDHGGTPKCHQELLENVKKLGYKTRMFYIYCDVDVAIKRAEIREQQTKRHTPVEMIRARVEHVENNKNIYKKIVDEFIELN